MDYANQSVREESRMLSAWLRSKEVDPLEMKRFGFRANDTNIEFRAMQSGASSLVAGAFYDGFFTVMDQLNVVRRASTLIETGNGEPLQVPVVDDTDETGALIEENDDLATDDVLIGNLPFAAYKYGSGILRMSTELLDDASPALMAMLGKTLAKRAARSSNVDFTIGDGDDKPFGVVTQSTLGKTAAADDAITYGDILDVQHSLTEAYWPRAAWMMNKATFKMVRQLADANGEPAFQNGKLLGGNVILNASMPAVAAESKPVLYGDFSNYLIREMPLEVRRYPERFVEHGQLGLAANLRCDGKLAVPSAVRHLAMAEAE